MLGLSVLDHLGLQARYGAKPPATPPAMSFASRTYVPARRCYCGSALIHVRSGSLDDRRSLGDLALYERSKRLLAAPSLFRNVTAQLQQAFARGCVVERFVQRIGELI